MADVPAPHLFRRVFHLTSPLFLLYYWIPECLPRTDLPMSACPDGAVTREALLFLVLGTALCIDIARISLRIPIFGMRGYETTRFSAYAWGAIGLAMGFLFFPPILVIPVFCGMAWVDPLCAWARRTGRFPWLPAAAYAAIFAGLLLPLKALSITEVVALTAIAVPVALLAEYPDLQWLDDDFLMTIVPLTALTASLFPIAALL